MQDGLDLRMVVGRMRLQLGGFLVVGMLTEEIHKMHHQVQLPECPSSNPSTVPLFLVRLSCHLDGKTIPAPPPVPGISVTDSELIFSTPINGMVCNNNAT